MKMRKEDKAALVDEIADRLGDAEAIFAVDYRGITVPQAAELRAKLADADTTFRVVKNRLAKRATERAGTAELDPLFEGPTALALVKGDAVAAAKAISTFGRQHDILAYKGGLMDGAPLDPDQFTTIARLPALDVLHSQLAGVVASPLTGLARGLGSMISGLAVALGEIQERGLVGGEGTVEQEPEETAKEEPAGAGGEAAVQEAEPAAPSEPEPAGDGAEGEASGGVVPDAKLAEESAVDGPEASGGDVDAQAKDSEEPEPDDSPESESDESSESESEDSTEPEPEEEE
ncbi:MAG: 50S ribosomal protein L10 [Actinomycetota bacterium]